jgi:hypothetical protein
MKTLVASVLTAVLLTAPAYAQMGSNNNKPTATPAQQEQAARAERDRAEIEKEYNATMKRLRSEAPAPKSDPWAHVRPAGGTDAKR